MSFLIDQIAELNRVLLIINSISDVNTPLSRHVVVKECQKITIEGRMPEHEQSIDFALNIGLIDTVGKSKIKMNREGLAFLDLNPEKLYDLSSKQKNFLIRRHFFDGSFQKAVKFYFRCYELSDKMQTLTWSETDGTPFGENKWVSSFMEQLGVIYYSRNRYIVKRKYSEAIAEFIAEPKGLTETKLFEIIEEKKQLGDLAEKLAFEWEVDRLAKAGYIVESHCVKRISKLDVSAGFDIKSFDGKSKGMKFDRFIEVKGSKGPGIRFIWSENEINVAKKLGDKYWIYYIGGVDVHKKEGKFEPILYQNPLKTLHADTRLTMKNNGIVVEGKVHAKQTILILKD